ncbi:MAG TPA: flagellar biosynthesis anti-sigma factor FlgM [Tepidisphaeraceae bacterium]|nr:flagellar biosynthesis anti-sigma factor FlgM [Tepidisphaeraceae bacterium]
MSQINNISQNPPVQNIAANPIQKQLPADAPQSPSPSDKLELSGASHFLQVLKANTDVRTDKIAAIRGQIQNGAYDADGTKLDAAVDQVLNDLNGQP